MPNKVNPGSEPHEAASTEIRTNNLVQETARAAAKKVLCRVEVVMNFRCCSHRLHFLQRDWWLANSSPKSNQLNEAQGIGRRSPDPFFLVRGRGLGTRLARGSVDRDTDLFLFTDSEVRHVRCDFT